MQHKYSCKKCGVNICKKTHQKTKLCRSCWLASKPKTCSECQAKLHILNTTGKCRKCYLNKYHKKRNERRRKRTEVYTHCFDCNKKLNTRYVKFCGRKCYDRYKQLKRRVKKANTVCVPVSRYEIYKRDKFKCYICKVKVVLRTNNQDWKQATLDHVVPLNMGGHHAPYNLRCCCRRCNSQKGKRLLSEHLLIRELEQIADQ